MRYLVLVLGLLAAMVVSMAAPTARAQTNSAVVVSACGTPPLVYVPGQPYPVTMDTMGKLCGSAAGSSSTPNVVTVVDGSGNPVTYPNPQPVSQPSDFQVTFTATANGQMTGGPVDITGYSSASCVLTSVGGGATVSWQQSPFSANNSTYYSLPGPLSTAGIAQSIFPNDTTTNNPRSINLRMRWFAPTVSSYVSGTISGTCNFKRETIADQIVAAVVGVAQENATPGNAVVIGMEARTSSKTTVSSGNSVRQIGTVDGRQAILPYSIPENSWYYAAASGGISNSTTAVTVQAAAGSNVRNYITSVQLSWDALTTATEFAIRDGASGTVLWRFKVPATQVGWFEATFPVPKRGSANTLLEIVTLTASGVGGVYANLGGFIAP